MDRFLEMLEQSDGMLPEYSLRAMGLSLLLAFVLGQLIAWVYRWTHQGLSYSQSFTQSLVLLTMVVALVMYVIGNSIVTAFGLIGALAIIRFRNVLKDTRDTVFVFFGLVLGMALGSQRYLVAILGAVGLLLVTGYLHFTAFGSRGRFDGHLSCRLDGGDAGRVETEGLLRTALHRFCSNRKQISARHAGDMTEYVFQVRLRDRRRGGEMIGVLETLQGVADVTLVLRDELAEV